MPWRFSPPGRDPDSVAFSQRETKAGVAFEADRPRQTASGGNAHALRETDPAASAEIFPLSVARPRLIGFARVLVLSLSYSFPLPETFAFSETHAGS